MNESIYLENGKLRFTSLKPMYDIIRLIDSDEKSYKKYLNTGSVGVPNIKFGKKNKKTHHMLPANFDLMYPNTEVTYKFVKKDDFFLELDFYSTKVSPNVQHTKYERPENVYAVFNFKKNTNTELVGYGFIDPMLDRPGKTASPVYIFESLIKGRDKYEIAPAAKYITDEFIHEFLTETSKLTKLWYNKEKTLTNTTRLEIKNRPKHKQKNPTYIFTVPSKPMKFPPKFHGRSIVEHWADYLQKELRDEVVINGRKLFQKGSTNLAGVLTKNDAHNITVNAYLGRTLKQQAMAKKSIAEVESVVNRWKKLKDPTEWSIGNVNAQNRWRLENLYTLEDDVKERLNVENAHVLLIDDNIDTGRSIASVYWKLLDLGFNKDNIILLTMFDMSVPSPDAQIEYNKILKNLNVLKKETKILVKEEEQLNKLLDSSLQALDDVNNEQELNRIESEIKNIMTKIESNNATIQNIDANILPDMFKNTYYGMHEEARRAEALKIDANQKVSASILNNENLNYLISWNKFMIK